MSLIQSLISSNKYNIKCPYTMQPIGICVHNTSNDAAAKNEISYMKNNNNQVSFHIAVDDKEAIQAIPFNRNAWAAGDGSNGQGNRKYIHVEICYSKSGGERFLNAEKRAAKEIALILKSYGWGINQVKKHQDFSKKYCPHRTLDMGWQRFLNMIQAELNGTSSSSPSSSTSNTQVNSDYKVGEYGKNVKVTADTLNVRSGRGTEHSSIGTLSKNSIVTINYILEDNRDGKGDNALWGSLNFQGKTGFIHLGYTEPVSTSMSTSSSQTSCDKEIKRYTEHGKCTVTASAIKFRDKPCTCHGQEKGKYYKNESVNYDLVVLTEKYVWISWIGASSGERRYMPVKDKINNERWGNCV